MDCLHTHEIPRKEILSSVMICILNTNSFSPFSSAKFIINLLVNSVRYLVESEVMNMPPDAFTLVGLVGQPVMNSVVCSPTINLVHTILLGCSVFCLSPVQR